ncbi:ribosome biogenesis protein TSR3 isoform X1, partial [Aphis craccivora]
NLGGTTIEEVIEVDEQICDNKHPFEDFLIGCSHTSSQNPSLNESNESQSLSSSKQLMREKIEDFGKVERLTYKADVIDYWKENKTSKPELKNNKTPGEDGIQGEILKNMDELAINRIHDIIENLWSEEQLPKDWGTALICPIFKKGDPQKCNSYRGIALLDMAYKVLSYCLLDSVVPK